MTDREDFPALTPPHQRTALIGHDEVKERLARTIDKGALANGWLITGGEGIGKATLAYWIARRLLSRPAGRDGAGRRADALIAAHAHPDLFVAERRWDEKKDRYETEIPVETIRKLTSFMNRTASMGGWRVAIVDKADELNRNAANALLKMLEEPPEKAVLLLVSNAPGRLLATIRSRCRRIDLRPAAPSAIADFLKSEGIDEAQAASVASVARGRPGFALTLARGEGADAVKAVDAFLTSAVSAGDASPAAKYLVGKAADPCWAVFKTLLIDALTDAARRSVDPETGDGWAVSGSGDGGWSKGAQPDQLVEARDRLINLMSRGDGLNLDRMQLILAMGRELKRSISPRAA